MVYWGQYESYPTARLPGHSNSNSNSNSNGRVFAENLFGLGFLCSVSDVKPILTHEKLSSLGKSGPNGTFNLIFLGLGWPWVGEFVGFILISICFPTQPNLVHRKHPMVVFFVIFFGAA